MRRRVWSLCVAAALVMPLPARGQSPVSDPEIAQGIKMVEEGEYDAAILTLDNAARRLATDPGKARELSQAYLYLGVAYVGKGHEAAAKAKFREAVRQIRDLTISPDQFPPKVIDLFEAAREEARTAAASAPAVEPQKKGGSGKKVLLFGALGAAAAGGAALALRKKDEVGCDTVFGDRAGPLSKPNDAVADLTGGPAVEDGVWFAELSWTLASGASEASLSLEAIDPTGLVITTGVDNGTRMKKAEWNGLPGLIYTARARLLSGGPVSFELHISGPCVN